MSPEISENPIMYPKPSPKWDVNTLPDLTGKVAIVTGANSPQSIGYQVAYQLAHKGARVYIGARSAEKAQSAITEMRRESPTLRADQLHPFVMDLGDLKQVQSAARDFIARSSRLDILVNNAAVLIVPFQKDAYGISHSFTTNHLGPFLFTIGVLPLMKKTAQVYPGVRIVNVSSAAHAVAPNDVVRLSSIEDFNQLLGGTNDPQSNLARYGLSKLANILFTKELQKHFDTEGLNIIALAPHPGGVDTIGAQRLLDETPAFRERFGDPLSPFDGALTVLFAAAHPTVWAERDKYAGAYLVPFGILGETTEAAKNADLAKQLWTTSEQVVKNILA